MRVLIVCQAFWPDNVATSLFLTDVGSSLVLRGHEVDVWASRYAYENPEESYPAAERHEGVHIKRMQGTRLGKKEDFWGRALDFFTFECVIFWHLLTLKKGRYDLVLGLSTPPLFAFFCMLFARFKKYAFVFWNMDLQPELAIESGQLGKDSPLARLLRVVGRYTCQQATKVVVLDRYMREYMIKQGVSANKVVVSQLWPVVPEYEFFERSENPYRIEKGFGDKIVIMYAGNQSLVHPLDTVLELARELRDDSRFLFVFVGGGVRKKDVTQFKETHQLENIRQYPFEPIEKAHISLTSADIQVVVMGDRLVGYTHPNKIYGSMYMGKPILYVGPHKSHIGDILHQCKGNIMVEHDKVEYLKQQVLALAGDSLRLVQIGAKNRQYAIDHFQPQKLRDDFLDGLETVVPIAEQAMAMA